MRTQPSGEQMVVRLVHAIATGALAGAAAGAIAGGVGGGLQGALTENDNVVGEAPSAGRSR